MPPSIEIQPLLQRVAQGDQRAFADLYDATGRYVFGILRRMLNDAEAAEEVAQEVYLQVWKSADSFDPERGSAWSWLALLTRSRAVDRMRAEGSYRGAIEGVEREPSLTPVANPTGSPHAQAMRSERSELVHGAVSRLPPDQREALELAFFGGLTHREIADRTETPLGTVKSRIRSGLSKLRDHLEPELGP